MTNYLYSKFLDNINILNLPKHPVQKLSEYTKSNSLDLMYCCSFNNNKYTVNIYINKKNYGKGYGRYKTTAIQKAAENALERFIN